MIKELKLLPSIVNRLEGLDHVAARIEDISHELGQLRAEVNQRTAETASASPERVERLDLMISQRFEHRPENDLYEALYGGSRSLRGKPSELGLSSTLCQQLHFSLDEYRFWMGAMDRRPRMHRKDWEWFYIAQAMFEHDMLREGRRGLVFAVGQEPLPSLFAKFGCNILATDQAPEQAERSGWGGGNMYSSQVDTIFHEKICDRENFFAQVAYRSVDMNDIPHDLDDSFDFCWSSCAFEHLGSLEKGVEFVLNSLRSLKKGGIAVHTTEFNLSSNDETIETENLSIYRRQDIEVMIERIERAGHSVLPVDWTLGHGFAETVVDLPPHGQSPHLRLQIEGYDCTSIGLVICKGA